MLKIALHPSSQTLRGVLRLATPPYALPTPLTRPLRGLILRAAQTGQGAFIVMPPPPPSLGSGEKRKQKRGDFLFPKKGLHSEFRFVTLK
jgi:hypothetical protein